MAIPRRTLPALLASLAVSSRPALAQSQPAPFITIASSTSTEQSGVFGHILPAFTQFTDIAVHVVACGTGQALDMGRRGEVDVVFTHDRPSEERFVAEGFAAPCGRRPVMYNDFVLAGPITDPANIRGLHNPAEALRRIAAARAPFISRSDHSGTHTRELRLWQLAGLDASGDRGSWYRTIGQSMLQALNTAAAQQAYILTDRGTWIVFHKDCGLDVLVEGDRHLYNQYSVMVVNPVRFPQVKMKAGQAFVDWVTGPFGQAAIASHRFQGEQLFVPNASSPDA
ncbi:substrate-binding domain-containing protein [Belnapia sp. T18]|uniref:Substrate-binding domain-containing protein n=1 Tax=Belnapia arida TaxID=2804533 RepID=A0ABS1UBJ4_9PROT|nr:substrate-binding domain-containing protein [Belnapia arida]MBL6082056.1 substrate-binding domain-containing protein [Belnapia arida]